MPDTPNSKSSLQKKAPPLREILEPAKKEDPRGPWFEDLKPNQVPENRSAYSSTAVLILVLVLAIIAIALFSLFAGK